jgi:hypothetical protein
MPVFNAGEPLYFDLGINDNRFGRQKFSSSIRE